MPIHNPASRARPTRAQSVGRPENFYPSPFFDIADNYVPKTIKESFDWCLYYFLTNPIISTVVYKLATYPITDILFKDVEDVVRRMYTQLFSENIDARMLLIEAGIDRFAYGNAFLTPAYGLVKKLRCHACGDLKAPVVIAR